MSIYALMEADDVEGRSFTTKAYVKAEEEVEARTIAFKNESLLDITVTNTGYFRVEKLSKKDGKKIVKSIKKKFLKSYMTYQAFLIMCEDHDFHNDDDYTKEERKIAEKLYDEYRDCSTILKTKYDLVKG